MPGYRPDIDGLRAVAVLAVIAYHAFPKRLPGGFVGVDVFFVISGFLITGLLLKGLAEGTYALLGFYARRIRRIFPALVVVVAAVLAAGWLVMLPSEFAQLGKHALAAAGFVANFAFWYESGYFDTSAWRKPLLHLWSLGIEEQYYALWPLLLALLWRRRRLMPWIIALAALGSFAVNLYLTRGEPAGAFFFPQGRLWELLLGGMVALAFHCRAPAAPGAGGASRWTVFAARPPVRECASALGLAMIAASFFLLHRGRFFPGWWVVLPTVGTALVAAAGPQAWLNRRLLAHPLMVGIGLISYPLYLWHWPLLSFLTIVSPDVSSSALRALKLAAVAAAFPLAILTYRFVEQPIRQARPLRARTVGALSAGMAAVALLGAAIIGDRLPTRLRAPEVVHVDTALRDGSFPFGRMNRDHERTGFQSAAVRSAPGPKTLFIGDSHMVHYWHRIEHVIATQPAAANPVFAVGCPPVPLVKRSAPGPNCEGFFEFATGLAKAPDVRTVVFSARWHGFLPSTGAADDIGRGVLVHPDGGALSDDDVDRVWDAFAAAARDLVASGKRVFLIAPNPESPRFDPRKMIRRFATSPPYAEHAELSRARLYRVVGGATERLRRIADATGAVLIDPFDYVCEPDACRTADPQGRPVYRDTDHFRPFWVIERGKYIDQTLIDPGKAGSIQFRAKP